MQGKNDWIRLVCPQCDHVIVLAPKDNLPQGELICPGCGAKIQPPGPIAIWIESLKRKAKSFIEPRPPRPGS